MKFNKVSIFGLFLAALGIASCSKGPQFEITGNITNATDSVLYLQHMSLDGPVVVDSVKLGADGSFSFVEDADTVPEFYRLNIAGQIINLSIDSTETVTVKAKYPEMAYKYDVEGSVNCTKIKEFALMQRDLQAQLNSVIFNNSLRQNVKVDSLNNMIEAYKNDVKTKIFNDTTPFKTYAYYVLFQTIYTGTGYSLIFDPHVNEDDVKFYAAVATSWDAFFPGSPRGENLHNIAVAGMKDVYAAHARANQTIDADRINTSGVIDLEFPDINGNMRKLSDLAGKVVLVDFCVYDGAQGAEGRNILLRELYDKYHAQGFEIYQVAYDQQEHYWKTKVANLPWISVRDAAGYSTTLYNVQSVPTFFLLSKDLNVYKRDVMIADSDEKMHAALDAEIRALLAK